MFNRWSVGEFLLTKFAKKYGFLDPKILFAKIQRFSKPSEVWVPAELLRSGMVLQARGLINSQAIQNNLDWVWPFFGSTVNLTPKTRHLSRIEVRLSGYEHCSVQDIAINNVELKRSFNKKQV